MMVYTVKDPYRDTFSYLAQVWGMVPYGIFALMLPLTRGFQRLTLRRYQYAYAAGTVLLMLLLLLFGHGPGGVHIQLFGFEPIEIIKILLVLFVVSYLTERRVASRWQDLVPLSVIYALCLALFLLVKDLGPAALLFGAFLTLLYLNTQRLIYPVIGVVLLLLAAAAGYGLHFGFFATRVTMWLHPWDNADRNGAQLAQGLWGMATGGISGSGLGLGQPQFVPRAGSDSVFATVGEELGLIGSLVVVSVYTLLIARGFRIALRAVTEFDRLLAAGLTTLMALQTMIILGGVTGLTPLTGITLPFVSFGASSLVADFFAIGLLLQISGKTLPVMVADRATPEWTRAARAVALGCAIYLLFGIGLFRLFDVQELHADAIATRILKTPDRDTKLGDPLPEHINPRLLAYAATIPRGKIFDRNGLILAQNPLTPEGSALAQIVYTFELGQNVRLRGFSTYAALLPLYHRRYLPFAAHLRGADVTLTIDSGLQQAATAALLVYHHPGAAVAIDPATGEVLAAASVPISSPASFNRALTGLYPPGSAFKIVTATAGLQHGLGNFVYNCHHVDTNVIWRFHGHIYSRRQITDEEGFTPHGMTDMEKALRVSCNIYFAHLGIAVGPEALLQAGKSYGLSYLPPLAKLGEDLPDSAYGQGEVRVTPLEMARVAQAVANHGLLMPTTFVQGGKPAHSGKQIMSAEQAAQLQDILAAVTTRGTARGVFDGLNVTVAGKTGSAQNNQGDQKTHSWFVGFAPVDHPTIAFACIVENGGAGRAAAAPVCREIVRKGLHLP